MEAVAKWDFVANNNDLLSFNAGDILLILFQDSSNDTLWLKAQLHGKQGLVSKNMIEIKFAPWFNEKIDRAGAENELAHNHFHKFIIRQSFGRWFLSYRSTDGKVWHFEIFKTQKGKFTFFSNDKGRKEFQSLNQLAGFVKKNAWYSAPWWKPHLSSNEDSYSPRNRVNELEKGKSTNW